MTYFDRTFQNGSSLSSITLPKEVQQYIYSFIYDEVMVHSWMHKYKINKMISLVSRTEYENHFFIQKIMHNISKINKTYSKHLLCIYFQQLNNPNENHRAKFPDFVDMFLQDQYYILLKNLSNMHLLKMYKVLSILIYIWEYINKKYLLQDKDSLIR